MLLSKFIGIAHSQPQHGRQQRCVAATVCAAAAGGHWPQGSGSVPLSASSLTRRIKQSSSTVELLQLHAAYRDSLDSIHYAALFNKLVAAHQSEHVEIGDDAGGLHHEQQQHLSQQRQQLYQQQHSPAAHRQQLLSVLLADLPYIIHSLHPGPLCVVLRALVKLHVQPYPQLLLALLHHAHRVLGFRAFQPRELCTVAHALAELPPLDLPWTGTPPSPPVAAARSSGPQQRPQQQHLTQQQQGQDDAATAEQHPLGVHSSWGPLLLQELFLALGSSLQCCNAQDAAQAVLAAARLRYAPSEAWLQLWLCRATQLLPQFTPQGLANAAYGLVRALQLRGQAGMSSSWDLAAAPPGNPTSSRSTAQLVQQQHQQQQQPQSALLGAARAWLQSCLQVSVLHASTLKPQELAGQLLWAAGKLSCSPPDPARHHLLASAQAMLPACDARHLCATLYAFALLGHRPDAAAARVFWSCLSWQVSNLGPRDLDEVLWAAGKLGMQPPGHVRDLLQQHALQLLVAGDQRTATALSGGEGSTGAHHKQEQEQQQRSWQGPRHVVGVLRGMAALGWQLHEKYLVRLQGVLLEELEECKPQDYANTLWALATARTTLEARWLDRVLMTAASKLEQFSPQELSITVWALAKLPHNPPKPWMQQLLLASLQQMDRFVPADYTQTLWALAELQYNPSPLWCASFWSKSGQTLTQSNFSAGELHALLLAAAKLEAQPPQKWLQAAAGAVERGLAGFSSQQLLEVLLVLQKLSAGSSASAAAVPTASSVGAISTRGTSAVCSSSIVSFSSRAGLQQPQRLLLQPRARGPAAGSSGSSSSKSRMGVSTSRSCPGVMRLYRQLLVSKRVVPAGAGLVRPVWPPSTNLLLRSDSSSSRSSDSTGISSSSSIRLQQQQGLAGASADEAFGLACLVLLMPDQLRSRVEHFPRLLVAERALQRVPALQQRL